MVSPLTTYIVLQGEVGVIEDSDLKCPIPTASHIVTFSHSNKHISVMMNIDVFTNEQAAFNCAEMILRTFYKESLTSPQFVARIMGGSEDTISQIQQSAILQILQRLGKQVQVILLPSPSQQITLCASNGEFLFSLNKDLEYLQVREHEEFKKNCLPARRKFEPRKATRFEPNLPIFNNFPSEYPIWITIAKVFEKNGYIDLTHWIRPSRLAIRLPSKTIETLTNMQIPPAVAEPIQKGDFNLAFRQAASRLDWLPIFQKLLKNASSLGIDFTAKDKTSGSVWDVARSANNVQALMGLIMYTQKYTYISSS